jgi:quercetin dioxygenase-like cupin family protein
MKTRHAAALATFTFLAGAGVMWAQQQAQSSREPQFDNDRVEVWKSTIQPKQPLTYHRHDNYRVLVALTDGQLNMTDPSGKILDTYHLVKGKAMWLSPNPPGQTHADVNPGTKPVEVMMIQLKK